MDQEKSSSRKFMSLLQRTAFGVAIGAGFSAAAYAEVRVSHVGDQVRVEIKDTALSEVLDALGAGYELRADIKADLGQPISGSYSGVPRDVISQLLRRYDFLVKNSDGKLAVVIYGISKSAAGMVPGTSVPAGPNAAAGRTLVATNTSPQQASGPNQAKQSLKPMTSARDNSDAGSSVNLESSETNTITNSPPPASAANLSVGSMLAATARAQAPGATASSGAGGAAMDMATMTRNAATAVQNLSAALQSASSQIGSKR